jgi:hypothetical protein
LESWPGLSHHFGIRPVDVGAYSLVELERYLVALQEINDEIRRHR